MNPFQCIYQKARSNLSRIVLPESNDPRIVEAALEITKLGLAQIVLVGDKDEITKLADQSNAKIDDLEVIDPKNHAQIDRYIEALLARRKHKGMTAEQARELINNPLIFGVLMVWLGEAEGCVAGAINTTADVVKAALQLIGMKPDSNLVSSFFIMDHNLPHQATQGAAIYADCALNINPDSHELASIAIDSADSATHLIGLEPKVALLSFSTAGSAQHEHVDKVVEAGKIINQIRPDIPLMSEVQFDAAILPELLARKAPDIEVKAPANIFIFPDLQSANIGYKIAQRIGGVKAVGPILQGLNHPINDLSRGCSVDDIVQLVAVTAVQAVSD